MIDRNQTKKELEKALWEEGKVFPIVEGPYRYRIMVHCAASGRQTAIFANGEKNYFSYLQIVNGCGEWIRGGTCLVPVLPDGRVIMVVEQRPPQNCRERPMVAMISGQEVDLRQFGDYSSLEFPGGAVENNGESVRSAAIRELVEETDMSCTSTGPARLYMCRHPIFPFGSDFALYNSYGVVYLPEEIKFSRSVSNDGGLIVVALGVEEVEENVLRGIICSAQAGVMAWDFLKRLEGYLKEEADISRYVSEHLVQLS